MDYRKYLILYPFKHHHTSIRDYVHRKIICSNRIVFLITKKFEYSLAKIDMFILLE